MNAGMKIARPEEIPWAPSLQRGAYSQQRKPLSSEGINAGLWQLAPGKKSFPFHLHHVTDEAMYVVSGHAKVRTSDGVSEIGPGDFVSFPAGVTAHQLINDGTEPLVYLGLSVSKGHDIVEYPDAGRIAAAIGKPPTGKRFMFREKDQADYFADDPDAVEQK